MGVVVAEVVFCTGVVTGVNVFVDSDACLRRPRPPDVALAEVEEGRLAGEETAGLGGAGTGDAFAPELEETLLPDATGALFVVDKVRSNPERLPMLALLALAERVGEVVTVVDGWGATVVVAITMGGGVEEALLTRARLALCERLVGEGTGGFLEEPLLPPAEADADEIDPPEGRSRAPTKGGWGAALAMGDRFVARGCCTVPFCLYLVSSLKKQTLSCAITSMRNVRS